ncbi:MAG: hypothetical protein ISR78_07205 [Spirochaetia bacterium]|nr:hypothetical protein [Spirochaetia bacterium]
MGNGEVEVEVDAYVTKAIDAFMPILREVYGDSLVMTALYGSAAAGGWVQGVSDINILIIVDKADPAHLFDLGKNARKTLTKYRITPHLLSKKELLTSSDIFPVEYLELKNTMLIIQGDDLFIEMEIANKNLRHQVESMLRGSVQTLRQIILGSSGDNRLLKRNLSDWAGSQLSLFRALISLTDAEKRNSGSADGAAEGAAEGSEEANSVDNLVQKLASRFTIDEEPFIKLLELRTIGLDNKSLQIEKLVIDLQSQYLSILDVVDSYDSE